MLGVDDATKLNVNIKLFQLNWKLLSATAAYLYLYKKGEKHLLPCGPKNFTTNSLSPPRMVTSCLLSMLWGWLRKLADWIKMNVNIAPFAPIFLIFIFIPDLSGAAVHELQIRSPLLPLVGIPALTSVDGEHESLSIILLMLANLVIHQAQNPWKKNHIFTRRRTGIPPVGLSTFMKTHWGWGRGWGWVWVWYSQAKSNTDRECQQTRNLTQTCFLWFGYWGNLEVI